MSAELAFQKVAEIACPATAWRISGNDVTQRMQGLVNRFRVPVLHRSCFSMDTNFPNMNQTESP